MGYRIYKHQLLQKPSGGWIDQPQPLSRPLNIYQSFVLHANLFMTSWGMNIITIRPDFQIATWNMFACLFYTVIVKCLYTGKRVYNFFFCFFLCSILFFDGYLFKKFSNLMSHRVESRFLGAHEILNFFQAFYSPGKRADLSFKDQKIPMRDHSSIT